jgi:hypothetical protein
MDSSRNSIISFVESQLKTRFCPQFVHESTQVFGKEVSAELLHDQYYVWPSRRVHRIARDTHHLLAARYPVSDEHVSFKFDCPARYQPYWATEQDAELQVADAEVNPIGRLEI